MAVVLTQQVRTAGTYTTPFANVPASASNHHFTLTLILSNADRDDPTLSGTLAVEGQYAGVTRTIVSSPWVGGSKDRAGNPVMPSVELNTTNALPDQARAVLSVNKTVSIGLDLSVD